MHVAVVGAGALGVVYGVRLEARGHARVTFVVRPGREVDTTPIELQRIDGDRARDVALQPARASAVPADADVILLCVRGEQLEEAAAGLQREVPVVMLTPAFPHLVERLRARLGRRLLAGMPSVVAYARGGGVVRYWLPPVARTLIEEPRPGRAEIDDLVRTLEASGFRTRLELGVDETNAATTASFIPLAMTLGLAGGVEALLADRDLVALALQGVREGVALAAKLGRPAPWVSPLTHLLGPRTLRLAVRTARRLSPEAVHYLDAHFAGKLQTQNAVMAAELVKLAEEKGTPSTALGAILERLVPSPP